MSAINRDNPNYLKPAPGYGQMPRKHCDCEIVPANPVRERAEFECVKCKTLYPKTVIEDVGGKLRVISFEGKIKTRKPRARR